LHAPIGLGFRVPMLVVSPFARGGWVCSDVFDHTSMLRFVESRFGVEVPNLSAWRRSVTGDLTTALGPVADMSVPKLPGTVPLEDVLESPLIGPDILLGTPTPPYPVPAKQEMPAQERGTRPRRA
jgi:phospholipase C